jgi:hypothetical protein
MRIQWTVPRPLTLLQCATVHGDVASVFLHSSPLWAADSRGRREPAMMAKFAVTAHSLSFHPLACTAGGLALVQAVCMVNRRRWRGSRGAACWHSTLSTAPHPQCRERECRKRGYLTELEWGNGSGQSPLPPGLHNSFCHELGQSGAFHRLCTSSTPRPQRRSLLRFQSHHALHPHVTLPSSRRLF